MNVKTLINILLDGLQDQHFNLYSDITLLIEDEDKELIIGELTEIRTNETLYFDYEGKEHKKPNGVSLYAK